MTDTGNVPKVKKYQYQVANVCLGYSNTVIDTAFFRQFVHQIAKITCVK